MENSLRNHALVQQQNQQKQLNREEYYRNNGIARPPSAGASASSSHYGANSSNTNSNRSRKSGSSGKASSKSGKASSKSGKGSSSSGTGSSSRSKSTRSGEASDVAVQGYPERHHAHHHQQQQQQYYYQQQQRYPQHYQQYYRGGNMPQQQLYDQYGYPVYRDTSVTSSQQSSSHHHVYIDQQQQQQHYGGHAGGSAADVSSTSQSHYSNILGSISGSAVSNHSMEEAYRRVGMRLSLSAHGGDSDPSRSSAHRARKAPPRPGFTSPSSCFKPFKEVLQHVIREREREDTSSRSSGSGSKKSMKGNIIRKMTLHANDLYRHWHKEHSRIHPNPQRRRRKSGSGGNNSRPSSRSSKSERSSSREELSPHQRLAQMTLRDGGHIHGHSNMLSSSSKKQTGSLSAVIESASQNSSTATRSTANNSRKTDKSRASSTIATENSMGTRNSFRSFGTIPPRGSCLTQPSEGVANDNLCDNVEGNLIVYENDNIHVPRKQVCVLTRGKIPKGTPSSDFRVISLLGQGTFAQVFRCLHVQTGQHVAVKIVKNKPAYTRQAAVEIDVIRALTSASNDRTNNAGEANKVATNDYMIDMVCYFLYKDHLCLVFELLGLNLYEVLKKRQFRGLPLSVTQTLVRQAVLGARTLAKRSIVHCDLKPENILLVDEDDSESVMSAGESKRVHSSSSSTSSNDKKKKSSPESNGENDSTGGSNQTQSSNGANLKTNQQEEKTQVSGNSSSTSETDNTAKNKEQTEEQKAKSHNSIQEKYKTKTKFGSPMESTIATNETEPNPATSHQIKLIDFGSACFEGQMSHTYIQSRFYRSPEVLLGLAYDSAIDMWSLGCVAAELFLGLPILPGVHEHDQLLRIIEMIGETPDWMLDQGTKSTKYFVKYFPTPTTAPEPSPQSSLTTPDGRSGSTEAPSGRSGSEAPRPLPQWRLKTQAEYVASLSQSDIEKKGGLAKLQRQPGNRYFRRKLLSDIIMHKGQSGKHEDPRLLKSFVHFLYGILDPDPWKRWTAFQVASHPFLTGVEMQENVDPSKVKDHNHANRLFNLYWEAPSDPSIYRRKLLNVQKTREKQQAARRGFGRGHGLSRSRSASPSSQDGGLPTVRNAFSNNNNQSDEIQPASNNTDEATAQARIQLHQGSYQGDFAMSSSMSNVGANHGLRLLGSGSGGHLGFSGPLSFSGSLGLPGSFNEVDFALALHRPGVVPMGDSVTTSTTSTTSMSSGNNSRSTYNQNNNQASQPGSYGTHQAMHYNRFTTGSVPRTSRSLNEGEIAPVDSTAIPTLIDPRLQQTVYSSSEETGLPVAPPVEIEPQVEAKVNPPSESKKEEIPVPPASEITAKSSGDDNAQKLPAKIEDAAQPTTSADNPAPSSTPNPKTVPTAANPNSDVYGSPELYQQQLVAMQQQFQQQQLLLQQQQAALALQQEQLRVYYSNISNAAAINAAPFGFPGTPAAAIGAHQIAIASGTATPVPAVSNVAGVAQQFSIPGAQATPSATTNTQQFTIAGAQTTPSAAINAQHFVMTSPTAAPITSQQFGIPGNTPSAVQAAQAATLNPQQFGLAGTATPVPAGGYYLVTNPDGSQMILPPNQGVGVPMAGQLPGVAPIHNLLAGQLLGLPSVGGAAAGLTGIPGIQAMPAGNMIVRPGSVPGMGQAAVPNNSVSGNASPSPGAKYGNSKNQNHHRQS